MEQHYEQVTKILKEMAKGNETFLDDESFRLSLLEIYSDNDHKKLSNLVSLLTNVYFKFGGNYVNAFEEAVCDIYRDYESLNKYHLNENEETMKKIREFYQYSIKEHCESN